MEDPISIQPWLRMYIWETARFCRGKEEKNKEEEEKNKEEEEEEERSVMVAASTAVTVEALLTQLLPPLSKPKWLQQEKWGGIVQENTGDCNVCSSAGYRIGSF